MLPFIITVPFSVHSAEVDSQLLQSLKSAASHDQDRNQQFHPDRDAKKVFSNEREKGLAGFLEEQERWDLLRERGLAEHRKQKKTTLIQEDSPESREDLKVKNIEAQKLETARLLVVKTRDQIALKASPTAEADELEELNLVPRRPRFDFRKRGSNKWIKKTPGETAAGKGNSNSGGFAAPPPAFDDYPIQNDYLPATNSIDGFEEIPPPPPPPIDFEGAAAGIYNGNIDAGFGEAPPPPPPPPPYNFN